MAKKNIIQKINDKFINVTMKDSFNGQPEFNGVAVKSVVGNPIKSHYEIELVDGSKWIWDIGKGPITRCG